jgi:hypothetical protein
MSYLVALMIFGPRDIEIIKAFSLITKSRDSRRKLPTTFGDTGKRVLAQQTMT